MASLWQRVYPPALSEAEAELMQARRKAAYDAATAPADTAPAFGVALSGGGIRSATFCLGVLQALARHGLLRRVDLLSTVSGGGYIGAALGRLYTRFGAAPKPRASAARPAERPAPDAAPAADAEVAAASTPGAPTAAQVEALLCGRDAPGAPNDWLGRLRDNGRYLAPNGSNDWLTALGVFLRNAFAVHIVVGVLLFALACALGLWAYLGHALASMQPTRLFGVIESWLQAGGLQASAAGLQWSPAFAVLTLLFAGAVAPLGWAYWLLYAPPGERMGVNPRQLLIVPPVTFGLVAWAHSAQRPFVESLAVLFACAGVLAWAYAEATLLQARLCCAKRQASDVRAFNEYCRHRVSAALGIALGVFAACAALALLDTLAIALKGLWQDGTTAALMAALATLAQLPRKLLALLPQKLRSDEQISRWQRIAMHALGGSMALVGYALFAIECIALCVLMHHLFDGSGSVLVRPGPTLLALLAALLVARWLGNDATLAFVNGTTLDNLYTARLIRAYLGASNPQRTGAQAGVTRVVDGDDLAPDDYAAAPRRCGAPLHLINTTLNETVDGRSQLTQRDRRGLNCTLGPLALSVGATHHALHVAGLHAAGGQPLQVFPQHDGYQVFDPTRMMSSPREPLWRPQPLTLGGWIGLSGAAFSTGLGQQGSLGLSLLTGMANARLGRWWDSRMACTDGRLARWLPAQDYLLAEWTSRFPGTARRYWFLTDGGHFENLGLYELVRRRLPLMLVVDAAQDAGYRHADLRAAIRKLRIDFGADLHFLDPATAAGWPALLADGTRRQRLFGTLEAIGAAGAAGRAAALARIDYADGESKPSLLLYLKAALPAQLPPDLEQYLAQSRELDATPFPQQSTADQFFDEAQWESYRKLGELLGSELFAGLLDATDGGDLPTALCQ